VFSGNREYWPGGGGGIGNYEIATIENSTLSDNVGEFGGGVYNGGTLTIKNSEIMYNSAKFNGGGVYNAGTLKISHGAITSNTAGDTGGGIYNDGGTVNLTSTWVTDNTPDDVAP
jgi:hypothetical protein